jgi:alkylresorcinol/alkylpyrone synthase
MQKESQGSPFRPSATPDSLEIMGWDVVGDGLRAVFSRDIPSLVRNDMGVLAQNFLATQGIRIADISGFLRHPGGRESARCIEDVLGRFTSIHDDCA